MAERSSSKDSAVWRGLAALPRTLPPRDYRHADSQEGRRSDRSLPPSGRGRVLSP